jgi:hypothetical protein
MRIPHLRGRFGRKRGWRRRVAGVGLLLILCLIAGYLYLANPQRLSGFASRLLRDMTGAEVAIDEARIGIDGRIHLRGLRLRVPQVAGDAGRLFEAEQVTIEHRLTSLLRGRFDATSLVVFGPTLVLTQDLATDRYNYQVLRDLRAKESGAMPQLDKLPEVFMRQGTIEFAELDEGRLLSLGKVQIDGKLTQIARQPGAYFFSLRQMTEARPEAQLTGRFNLRDLSVSAELDSFSFSNPYGDMLPRKLRTWWQRMSPAGSLPTVRVAYDPDPAVGLHVVIEVRDVELSLPYADPTADGSQPAYPRMSNVSGTFTLVRDTVMIDQLRGKIEGIGYQIDGRIDGLDEAAPFRFEVSTDEFDLAADRSLYTLPREVESELRRFDPSGRFHISAVIERPRRGALISYDGTLSLRGAYIRYVNFAYPLHDVEGTVRFTDQSIEVVKLDGRGTNGGRVVVTGSVVPPGDGAAVQLHIVCTDLPLDEHVLSNIERPFQSVIQMLGDFDEHRRMVELGLIRTSLDGEADANAAAPESDAPPLFDLGGTVNVEVKVSRDLGPVQPYVAIVELDMAGVNLMFRHWPYPLQLTSGRIRIEPGIVRIDDIKATGPRGGFGEMHGVVAKVPGPGDRWDPELHITRAQLPLDDLLLATIPSPHDQWLRDFRLRGTLDATGRIYALPDGEVTFTIDTHVRDATADPFASGFDITDLSGKAKIERGRVTVTDMTGRRDQSVLVMGGIADYTSDPSSLTLSVTGTDLRFEPGLLGLIPPEIGGAERVREMFDAYRPAGRFDARFDFVTKADDGGTAPHFTLAMQPKEVAFELRGKRLAFDHITGEVHVRPDTIRLDDLAARFAHGQVSGSGLINIGDRPAVAINFTAEASRIDAVARAVLPPAVTRTLDGLELQGAYTIPLARYVQRSTAEGDGPAPPRIEFEGTVQLREATASVGVPVTGLTGDLYVRAMQPADSEWPHLDVRLDASRLYAAGRLVEPLQLHMATSDEREDLLHIQQLRGVCYGGLLVGEGWIDLARQGMFRITASLSEVALTPFMSPKPAQADERATTLQPERTEPVAIDTHAATPDPRLDRSKGVLTASLTIEGTPGDVASRRGRGALDIRNAALYELPMAMAALQIANLTLPQSNAFDRASARFILDGDRVRFDTIRFEAPTVEMSGDGMMQLSTRRLDLRLVSRNPAAPQLGAVSELFNVLKDELITIQVTGTLDDPKARVTSFRGVRRSVDRVFGDDTPRRPATPTGKRRHREAAPDPQRASTSGQ